MGIIKSDAAMDLVGVAGERAVVSRWWLPELVEVHAGTSHVGCERFCTEWAIEEVAEAEVRAVEDPKEATALDVDVLSCGGEGGASAACADERVSGYVVDVQELARTGSINGQALWGVRVARGARGKTPSSAAGGRNADASLPEARSPAARAKGVEKPRRGKKVKSVEEKAARVGGVRLDPSVSPIRIWDAGEAAAEMRGEGSGGV